MLLLSLLLCVLTHNAPATKAIHSNMRKKCFFSFWQRENAYSLMLIVSFFFFIFFSFFFVCACVCLILTEICSFGMGRWTLIIDFNDFWTNQKRAQPIGSSFIYRLWKNRMVPWHCMVHYRVRNWTRWYYKSYSQCKMLTTIQSNDIHRISHQSIVHNVCRNVM